jgi:hypothetical protein
MFFNIEADLHKKTSSDLIKLQYVTLYNPYESGKYHAASLLYPFGHVVKIIVCTAQILKGSLLLLEASVNSPAESLPQVVFGLINELTSLCLTILNLAVSLISLVSRNLCTLFHFGYRENTDNQTAKVIGAHGIELGAHLLKSWLVPQISLGLISGQPLDSALHWLKHKTHELLNQVLNTSPDEKIYQFSKLF